MTSVPPSKNEEILRPISLTRKLSDIHSGGFSAEEEDLLGITLRKTKPSFTALHQLITYHRTELENNLLEYKKAYLEKNSAYMILAPNVYAHETARIDSSVVFDGSQGTIVIEKNVHVMPFSYIIGPVRLDEHAVVNSHTRISNSYIGKFSKVGGEINNSVVESYSNKAHTGYLGDAYVGSWVNIGAGASNSNLKNSYGTVAMNEIDTGEQFLGTIIADYAKIAINTAIYTGKIIGVASCIYGTVTEDVPSFTNYISKNNLIVHPLKIALTGAKRMRARRNLPITKEETDMLSYAYTQTETDRKKQGVVEGPLLF